MINATHAIAEQRANKLTEYPKIKCKQGKNKENASKV
jgi:hypothetical protein